MIFVILGSQKFQFNRLLKKVDELIQEGEIQEEVIAQSGNSDYIPNNYTYKNYFNHDEFDQLMRSASLIITHGGTGTIMEALRNKKKVIAVQRMAEYQEHVDNHQKQILMQFEQMNLISPCYEVEHLEDNIRNINEIHLSDYVSERLNLVNDIKEYLNNISREIM